MRSSCSSAVYSRVLESDLSMGPDRGAFRHNLRRLGRGLPQSAARANARSSDGGCEQRAEIPHGPRFQFTSRLLERSC